MAVAAQESLVIEASVDDKLSAILKQMESNTQKFADSARQGFEKGSTEAKKFHGVMDIVERKIGALGKAFVGFFAIDIAAKLFGFSSAMDVLRKASDAVAESIRGMFEEFTGTAATEASKNIAVLREQIAKLQESAQAGRATLKVGGGGELGFALSGFGSPSRQLDALQRVLQAQKQIDELTRPKAGFSIFGSALRRSGAGGITELDPFGVQAKTTSQVVKELEKDLAKLAETYKRVDAESSKAAKSVGGTTASHRFAVGGGFFDALAGGARGLGRIVIDEQRRQNEESERQFTEFLNAQFEIRVAAERKAAEERARITQNQIRNQRDASSGGFGGFGFDALAGPLADAALAGAKKIADALIDAAKAAATFGGGVRQALQDLGRFTSANSLGQQATYGSFDSFRGFFNDIVSGSKKASDAFQDFARNFIANLIDMIAQVFAFRAVSGLSGLLGFGGGVAAAGFGGAGTGLDLPSAAVSGGAGSGLSLLQSGGGVATLNLTVVSLDPRGAADVVLEQMPAISRAFQGRLGGSDRQLINAVRGV